MMEWWYVVVFRPECRCVMQVLSLSQIPGLPPMPPMPSMPLPPGMGVLQAMGMMGGPPPPGIRLSMESPGVSSGMAQDDAQKMAQRVRVCVTDILVDLNDLVCSKEKKIQTVKSRLY